MSGFNQLLVLLPVCSPCFSSAARFDHDGCSSSACLNPHIVGQLDELIWLLRWGGLHDLEHRRTDYRLSRHVFRLNCVLPEGSQTSCHSRTEAEPGPSDVLHLHHRFRTLHVVAVDALEPEVAGI